MKTKARTAISAKSRQGLRKLLLSLLEKQTSVLPDPAAGEPFHLVVKDGGQIVLTGDALRQYDECCELITPNTDKPQPISRHACESALNDAILTADSSAGSLESRIQKGLGHLEATLSRSVRAFSVCLPIMGLQLERPIRVGVVGFIRTEEMRRIRWAPELVQFRREAKADAWAVVLVNALDSGAALDVAAFRAQLALDIVNLYARRLEGAIGAAAYQPGVRSFERTVALVSESPRGASPSIQWKGPPPIELRPVHQFAGYRRLTKLLSTEKPSEIDDRLLSALRWLGRGVIAPWNEQAFLSFMVALESLVLGPSRDSELSYRLRMRTAKLLAKKGSEAEVLRSVSALYSIRSKIVHQGSFEVTADNREHARQVAMFTFFRLLRDVSFVRLKTNQQAEEWFERQLLGNRIQKSPKASVE